MINSRGEDSDYNRDSVAVIYATLSRVNSGFILSSGVRACERFFKEGRKNVKKGQLGKIFENIFVIYMDIFENIMKVTLSQL